MKFTFGEAETPIDYNFLTDRLLSSTFGATTLTPGNPEVFEMYFSNGHTLRIIGDKSGVRINLVPPSKPPAKK